MYFYIYMHLYIPTNIYIYIYIYIYIGKVVNNELVKKSTYDKSHESTAILGYSVLSNNPLFDPVFDCPFDVMHLLLLNNASFNPTKWFLCPQNERYQHVL